MLPEFAGVGEVIPTSTLPVYELIAQMFQLDVDRVEMSISAGIVSEDVADTLEADTGTPTLELVRRYWSGGRVFEVSVSQHPGDRFNYSLEFRRGWKSGGGWGWA